ncbi:hypothetical protein D6C91_08595 [Aureobasidium pullulans]|uniref:Uncharacterized protein n=1 Tax=Aureobasidium pullulans TaxID=5580 RepID=A0A4S8SLI5_AURPU|nr:hypothetical protein D6D28_04250 [Aureobasidium pullulans]THZ12305.1 hypothetical protein D6C91_08595 [Aureobasidium pullulans]
MVPSKLQCLVFLGVFDLTVETYFSIIQIIRHTDIFLSHYSGSFVHRYIHQHGIQNDRREIPGGHWIHTPGTNLESGIYVLASGLACDPSETVPRHLRWEDESLGSHNYRELTKILRVLERQWTFPQLKEGEIFDTNVLVQILRNWDTLMKGRSVIWFEKDHNLSGETPESGTKKIILRALGDTRWAVFTNFFKHLYNIETTEEAPSWTTIQPNTEEQEDTAIDNLKRLARVFDGGAAALEPPIETLMTTRYRVDRATELVQAAIKGIDHVKGLLSTSLEHLDMTRQQLQIHESEQNSSKSVDHYFWVTTAGFILF